MFKPIANRVQVNRMFVENRTEQQFLRSLFVCPAGSGRMDVRLPVITTEDEEP